MSDHIDHRANGLNVVRLVLASAVIFWHSYALTGRSFPFETGGQFLGDFAVDGFFAISGYLLIGSWIHKPKLTTYLKNRVLRIVPAFWVCLVVTAFVFAPAALLIQGHPLDLLLEGDHSAPMYVLQNLGIHMSFYDIAGTPLDVPYPGVWDGSLWTLQWEFMAYLALATLGVMRLADKRWVVLGLWLSTWAVSVVTSLGLVEDGYWVKNGARLGFMFLTGMIIYMFGRIIPAGRWCVAVAAIVVAASAFLPNYRLVGGAALAYLVIWVGGAIRNKKLQLKDRDVSYGVYIYAVPVQQLLVVAGVLWLPAPLFSLLTLVLVLPIAASSWVFVERPMLRLKKRGSGGNHHQPADHGDQARAGGIDSTADGSAKDGSVTSTAISLRE